MLYRIVILSDENNNFLREIKINSDASFMELQNIILESCGYQSGEMASFFLCDEQWNKGQEITIIPMGTDSDVDNYVMDETRLEELIDDEGQHLIFVFDYLSDRFFYLRVAEFILGETVPNPVISSCRGTAPMQISTPEQAEGRRVGGDVADKKAATAGVAEDFLLDEDYNDEGIDEAELMSLDEIGEEDLF